jgi:hypothetical protein
MFYYEAIQVRVPTTGLYSFRSISSLDAYGYLYENDFNPWDISSNLLTRDDDSGGSVQFLITYTLQSTGTYVLVFTTYSPGETTAFSIAGSGPAVVSFTRMEITWTNTPSIQTNRPTTQTYRPTSQTNRPTTQTYRPTTQTNRPTTRTTVTFPPITSKYISKPQDNHSNLN